MHEPDENILQEHDEDANPHAIHVLSILAIVFGVLACVIFNFARLLNRDLTGHKVWLWSNAGLVFLIALATISLFYARNIKERNEQDYHGKMRVLDVRYQTKLKEYACDCGDRRQLRHQNRSLGSCSTCYEMYYEAILTLDWGYDWACGGDHNSNQCQASEVKYCSKLICWSNSCSQPEYASAWGKIHDCVEEAYNPNATYTPYDPFVGPSHDVDWPSIVAYGDCGTCEVKMSVPSPSSLKRTRYASLGLVGAVGAVALGLLVALAIRRCAKQKRNMEKELRDACSVGDLDRVRRLLKKGVKPNHEARRYTGNPLNVAKTVEVAQVLLEYGADVWGPGSQYTPLHTAVEEGRLDVAEFLLDNGANIEAQCGYQRESPLHLVSRKRLPKAAKFLLDRGAAIQACDRNKNRPIHKALEDRIYRFSSSPGLGAAIDVTELLLDRGAILSLCNDQGQGPLHLAANIGEVALSKILLDRGASCALVDVNGKTPLHIAASRGESKVVQLMLDYGADVNARDNNRETPLHQAAKQHDPETARVLLDAGADVGSRCNKHETPLHLAARWGGAETIRLLLDCGADPGASRFGWEAKTPHEIAENRGKEAFQPFLDWNLQQAHYKQDGEGVQKWLKKGANKDALLRDFWTPLHQAAREGNAHAATRLLLKLKVAPAAGSAGIVQSKANVDAINAEGKTPLHVAALHGKENVARLLLEGGAEVDTIDKQKRAPLHLAASAGNVAVAVLLLNHDADPDVVDGRGLTPLCYGAIRGHADLVREMVRRNPCNGSPRVVFQEVVQELAFLTPL